MSHLKGRTVATLIGDVVGSRDSDDRRGLHRRLLAALADETARSVALEPPAVTVGDEFQGCYPTVGAAIAAGWRLRTTLLPEVDVRVGIGWGPVTRLDDTVQDGPGWWAAREAIDWVAEAQTKAGTRAVRTAYRSEEPGGPDPAAVDAALRCRDHLLGSLDERSQRILGGLMAGRTQAEIADSEDISASAVSQRVRGDGLALLLQVADQLAEVGARR
ncbi:SatD family protein [Marihabitans asiaticum]|uniref:SatD family protein n=1 Tax=Marihabitans asiaticum TaxID=415218 RepID=A0A560W7Y2_9MICO|nr:SatD family protein [Marihabitans asiaticum]TWD13690.1 SatD family protein [Marihabitans asiaticum]